MLLTQFFCFSGPQFSHVVMDQWQTSESKSHIQTVLKDNCKCDYESENGTSQTKIESILIFVGMLATF